ncbi:MAG: hydroxyacylglutathione hydrolase [Deltaproteobacteria bacterium HGW-Deltaproteobacteria-13]|jgi:hydroxyacylglutathione hydrolase|nr:MAG: hydroxyacylglutathione hydrolase [Deltaproteobacteria bacterium HGW-Deltaproteobacteria-13]
MLNIEQFHYGADNLAYIIYGEKQALAIDGGAWKEILSFLKARDLTLTLVTNTHSHYDHTPGNDHLIKATGAAFLKSAAIPDNHKIIIDGQTVLVYRTPGHTDDSVCFHAGNFLITGDTLFNATIGNCFSGNQKNFYLSIKRLMALHDETIIYAGHDYITDSLAFARHLEPDNRDIEVFRNAHDSGIMIYSTLAEERKINPYLRFNEDTIINILKKNNLPFATEWERWESLMSIE